MTRSKRAARQGPRTWPAVALQFAGAAVALAGLVLLAGPAWALLAGGLALVGVGAAREAGWL